MGVNFIREANWLGPDRVRAYLWLLAALNFTTLVFLLATSHHGVDRNGFLLGTDFLSFWTTGQMLVAGTNPYDAAAHIAAQHQYFETPGSYTAFFYPPPFLLFCYPLGFLPYFPALGLWLGATGAAYVAVVRQWLRALASPAPLSLCVAAFPPVLIAITHGQSAFLAAALLGLGALWVIPRPVLAGVCFGLAVFKPQFGIVVPIVLAFTGRWRVIGAAVVTVFLIGGVVSLAFDVNVWTDWLAVSAEAQAALEQGAVGFAKMMSPFASARLLGASIALAYAIQVVLAALVVALLVRVSWRREYTPALGAVMLAGAPLVTPFVLDYDLVLLAFPLIWLASQRFAPWDKVVLLAAFAAAAFARPLGVSAHLPIMPFILAALFGVIIRRQITQVAIDEPDYCAL